MCGKRVTTDVIDLRFPSLLTANRILRLEVIAFYSIPAAPDSNSPYQECNGAKLKNTQFKYSDFLPPKPFSFRKIGCICDGKKLIKNLLNFI